MANDYPWEEVTAAASQLAAAGYNVHQKFTCAGCGQRLTMEEPNQFYEQGSCDKCDAVTDIKKQGCNYLLHKALR
jgi:hypothetical protein